MLLSKLGRKIRPIMEILKINEGESLKPDESLVNNCRQPLKIVGQNMAIPNESAKCPVTGLIIELDWYLRNCNQDCKDRIS